LKLSGANSGRELTIELAGAKGWSVWGERAYTGWVRAEGIALSGKGGPVVPGSGKRTARGTEETKVGRGEGGYHVPHPLRVRRGGGLEVLAAHSQVGRNRGQGCFRF